MQEEHLQGEITEMMLWALKGLSHQILKSFLSSTILNQYFLYGRWWFRIFFIQGIILIFKDEVLMYMTQNAS